MTEQQRQQNEAGWSFDNSYVRLPQFFYSRVQPEVPQNPRLVILNSVLAVSLGLDAGQLRSGPEAGVFAGQGVPEGAEPLAQAYAGHQFGHFTRLGDGRAILLGEQITPSGERLDIQLKGSGRTPYSRQGDGKAAIGPMLREYIISEAMHALGIPTSRSLAVALTGQPVIRETHLPGAVLTRVAASHLRVGTFQYAAAWGGKEEIKALADYTLHRHYPVAGPVDNRYLFLLNEVIGRQAALIAKWQLAGFIHGVMNTDNMALSGETIDYGPCAFMDTYDPATVFSSIDRQGRYAYGNQPGIAAWNLARFAETLLPLLHEKEEEAVRLAEKAVNGFADRFQQHYLAGMRAKLGLFGEEAEDEALIQELLEMMETHRADYTNTFRALTFGRPELTTLTGTPEYKDWLDKREARMQRQKETDEAAHSMMRSANPAVIPRNHRVEEALAAAEQEDYEPMDRLLSILSDPYAHNEAQEEFSAPPEPSDCAYRTYCGT
ncbi:YdiU family protein [Shouchella clausii]